MHHQYWRRAAVVTFVAVLAVLVGGPLAAYVAFAGSEPAGAGYAHAGTVPSPYNEGLIVPRDACTHPGDIGTGRGDGKPYVCEQRAGDACPHWHRIIVPGEPTGHWSPRPAKPCPACSPSPSPSATVPGPSPTPSTPATAPTTLPELPVTG